MTDTTQALEQKADRSRKRLTGLMDDLQSQMSPGVMLDNALGFSSDGASDVGELHPSAGGQTPASLIC